MAVCGEREYKQIPHKHTDTTAVHADVARVKARHQWQYVESGNINRYHINTQIPLRVTLTLQSLKHVIIGSMLRTKI